MRDKDVAWAWDMLARMMSAEQAVERVRALADQHEECCGYVKVDDLRAAVEGPSC